jgi:UrcA family protein
MKSIGVLFAVVTVASAGSAFAQTSDMGREPNEIHISVDDYNFQKPSSVKRFQAHLWRAAVQVCDSDMAGLGARGSDHRCAHAAYQDALQSAAKILQAENVDTTLLLASR